MGAADTDVVLRTIKDPTALYLRQHLKARGIEVVDPARRTTIGQRISMTASRMGQVGRGDGFYCGHL